MNAKEFIKALNNITEEKNISKDIVFEAMELALATAYKKNFDSKTNVEVKINRETGDIKVYSYFIVVNEYDNGTETTDEEGKIVKVPPTINRDAQMLLSEAREIDPTIEVGETIEKEVTPKDFGRVAAGTAKQVLTQKIREAEREVEEELMSEAHKREADAKKLKRIAVVALVVAALSLAVGAFMPSKETCYQMIAAHYLTYENVDAVGGQAKEVVDYIFDKVDEVTNDE